jgi:hypothetical protein
VDRGLEGAAEQFEGRELERDRIDQVQVGHAAR